MNSKILLFSAVVVAGAGLSGCGKKQSGDVPHYGKGASSSHGHAHKAPNGGELVELGDHQFNLELKFDAARGVLQAWVLDAHAENFVRVGMASFDIEEDGGQRRKVTLHAGANTMTGETVGDTSYFEGSAPWLREVKHFDGVVKAVRVRGVDFRDIHFHLHP